MRLVEILADGKPRSGQELHRLGVLGEVVEAQAQGHVIHRWLEQRDPRQRVWWYRLARQTGSVGPSVSEESGSTGDPADPVGRVPRQRHPLSVQAPAAAPALLSPSPSTTQATGLPVGEPETRPQTLFDVPARPQWA